MKNYLPFWLIIFTAFVIIFTISAVEDIKIGSYKPKSAGFYQTLFDSRQQHEPDTMTLSPIDSPIVQPAPVDTASKTILFIGDSMLDGLSPRLAAYADYNGHKLYTVIWYSSTTEHWAKSGKLSSYIRRLHPDYIFICLGSNELSVKNITEKRDDDVRRIITEIGDIPYLWIGPPNWRPDTGINMLIATHSARGTYFKSDGMHLDRNKDGAHPTNASAALWMDSIARWMPAHSSHPIRLAKPDSVTTSRPVRVYVHQPDEF